MPEELGKRLLHDIFFVSRPAVKDLPGVGKVTFEVFAEGDGARLRVTNEGLESFTLDIPEFSRESCEGGWKYFIQGNLQDYLSREKIK